MSCEPLRVFHKCTKLAILALLPTLYSYIYSCFLLYLQHMILLNVKLYFVFPDFIGAESQLRQSWQDWHSCVVGIL